MSKVRENRYKQEMEKNLPLLFKQICGLPIKYRFIFALKILLRRFR